MIDVLYVSFNRLAYTRESFTALLEHTDWSHVAGLYVADDASTDGTRDYLVDAASRVPEGVTVHVNPGRFGGPVAATNWYLDHPDRSPDSDRFAKIDNDFVVCPGWDTEVLRQMTLNASVDIFGIEPRMGPAQPVPNKERHVEPARFIGGKGIMRHRAFEKCRPVPHGFNGYFGFTEWQRNHPDIEKAWVTPDLPAFGLDQLPFEPWLSIEADYVERGWQRHWDPYDRQGGSYWEWWVAGDSSRRTSS